MNTMTLFKVTETFVCSQACEIHNELCLLQTKLALHYRPKGRMNIGRPKKRWSDQLNFEDQGTGNTPNPS